MKSHPKQISAVLALPGPKRYDHFIKRIADTEEVWGLYDSGWALAETDDGEPILPFWPAEEYAALCAKDGWSSFKPQMIPLEEFWDELLPKLKKDSVLPGIFQTPNEVCVTPTVDELLTDLNRELEKYE